MENLEILLSLTGTILGLIITLLTIVVKSVKNAKAKKITEQMMEITNAIIPFVEEAEKFANYSGSEKKSYVLTKVNQYAIEHKLPFNALQISDKIEELVALTKQVNNKKEELTKNGAMLNNDEIKELTNNTTQNKMWL